MSIQSKRQSAGGAAPDSRYAELQLFVDRHRYVREFTRALHRVPPESKVLFFYGVGGVGKSLLLRYLREHACTRLDHDLWVAVDSLGDAEFRATFENSPGETIPTALHDFSAHVVGEDDPLDAFHGPLMLRAQLGRLGFRFPRFDFAVILFAQRKGYSSEKVAALLPTSDRGVTGEVLSFLIDHSKTGAVAKFAVDKLFERFGDDAALAYARHRAPEEQVAEIYHLEVETELVPRLARFLAEDINEGLDRRREKRQEGRGRLCLLFDTHDAFWGETHFGGSESQRHERDEWFRTLLVNLDLDKALVVVTGRERPRWPAANREQVPAEYLHEVAVGDLDLDDADIYLRQRGVESDATRAGVLRVLRTDTGFHPLSLGLAADLVNASGGSSDLGAAFDGVSLDFAVIGPALLDRLLSYLPAEECHAISALGACRTFDQDIYLHLGAALSFAASAPAFAEITRLSFVIPYTSEEGGESWKIHTLLRKSLIEGKGDVVQSAHRVLAAYYEQRAASVGDPAHLEQLFHTSRLAGRHEEVVAEWLETLYLARELGDTQMLMRVLGLRDELVLTSWQQRAQLAVGRKALYSGQGRDDDSEQVLTEAIVEGRGVVAENESDRLLQAELLLQLGWVERYRTRFPAAAAAFSEAVDLMRSGSPAVDHMRARLYFGWSGVPADAEDREAALHLLQDASRAYTMATDRLGAAAPMRLVSDASFTETCIAAALRRLDRAEEAEQAARRGVKLAEQALEMAPADFRTGMNLESAYGELAQSMRASDPVAARELADRRVATCRWVERATPEGAARLVRGLHFQGELRAGSGDTDGATASLDEALALARRLHDVRPRHRGSHLDLARVLLSRVQLGVDEPGRSLSEAEDACRAAIALASGWQEAHALLKEVQTARP
jgi:hypothetical protein